MSLVCLHTINIYDKFWFLQMCLSKLYPSYECLIYFTVLMNRIPSWRKPKNYHT
jgi:hypothetical protein